MENLPNVWKNLWAPWRVEYFEQKDRDPDFLLTAAQSSDDEEHLVLLRLKSSFLIMNRYPYTAGHLMAVPYRKCADLHELAGPERLELLNLAIYAEDLLRLVAKAQGFNIGWNIGSAAGAGAESHVHLHIVPRWAGDHNFMTVLGEARIIPDGLRPLYQKLRAAIAEHPYEQVISD
jgi:ATP adenylyltransferase